MSPDKSDRSDEGRQLSPEQELAIAEKWTNTSAVPSSGAMKPKPLSALNHFTVPVASVQVLYPNMPRRDAAGPTASLSFLAPEPNPTPGHGLSQHQPLPAAGSCGPAVDRPAPHRPAEAGEGCPAPESRATIAVPDITCLSTSRISCGSSSGHGTDPAGRARPADTHAPAVWRMPGRRPVCRTSPATAGSSAPFSADMSRAVTP